jgi:hypothetical protein
MDDDEQHLVVLVRQRTLCVEQLVEAQILGVAQGMREVPMNLLVAQIYERFGRGPGLAHGLDLARRLDLAHGG